jgi:hypothetical protein
MPFRASQKLDFYRLSDAQLSQDILQIRHRPDASPLEGNQNIAPEDPRDAFHADMESSASESSFSGRTLVVDIRHKEARRKRHREQIDDVLRGECSGDAEPRPCNASVDLQLRQNLFGHIDGDHESDVLRSRQHPGRNPDHTTL